MTDGAGSGRTRAVHELADLLRPLALAVTRRLPEIVAGLAVLVTALVAFAIAGSALDDRAIAANPAVAQAEVLEGSSFARTLVRFTVANGEAVVPERGVFYPRGLQPGETVAVEYDVTDPELVRVAGRSALTSSVPLLLGVLVVWALLGPLSLWLRRRRARE
ncbi:DUF3592 domain-containing protein [Pseudonocardia nigra]|uniref:DUF3592 domain-containing protein n=1 Tax=Pseudonocardia nigra TaxID=1921578 RepID=UPI001C5F35EB|nr:DUF3592 domain-containing protein [Pseudonocardia nigra]